MAWASWSGITSTTLALGNQPATPPGQGVVVSDATTYLDNFDALFTHPFLAGTVEATDGQLVGLVAAPDFSMLPKWRKVVRTIG